MNIKNDLEKFAQNWIGVKLPKTFVDDFYDVFLKGQFDEILKFFKKEYKGQFSKNELDISDRVLKHWETEKVIPANRTTDRGWRKYSYLDQVWTIIVIQLRRFGYSLSDLKTINSYLTKFSPFVKCEYPLLVLFYAYAVSNNDTIFLIIYDTSGDCELALKSDYLVALAEAPNFQNHIIINVTSIMESIDKIFPKEKPVQNISIQQISNKEKRIIEVYRKTDVTEIIIKKSLKTQNITYSSIQDPKAAPLAKSLGDIEFGSISVNKNAGKVVNVKVSKTEKL